MADVESSPECGRWEAKSLIGGRKRRREQSMRAKRKMFWKAPLVQIVQIVRITHTNTHTGTKTRSCVQTPTHTN